MNFSDIRQDLILNFIRMRGILPGQADLIQIEQISSYIFTGKIHSLEFLKQLATPKD